MQKPARRIFSLELLASFVALAFLLSVCPAWSGQAEDALNEALKLHEAGKPKEALVQYDKAIKANPKLSDAYFNRGNAYYDLGENQHAINDYSQAIRLNPKDAEAFYNRGNAYRRLKKDDLALSDYTSAIKLRSEERRVGKECRSRWSP